MSRLTGRRAGTAAGAVAGALALTTAMFGMFAAPGGAATTSPCKVLSKADIQTAFGGTVSSGKKGLSTPVSTQCEFQVGANADRPDGTVIVHLTTTKAKPAYTGLKKITQTYAPVDGLPNALYAREVAGRQRAEGRRAARRAGQLPDHRSAADPRRTTTRPSSSTSPSSPWPGSDAGAEVAVEFDPFDYGFHRDPYPTYAWLREHAPVYHNERLDFWALSRFDDVLDGLHDPDTYTSTGGVAIEHTDAALKSMIEMDPPEHTQMRKLIARRFTPRRIAELEPRVRTWTNELLDSLAGRSRVRRGARVLRAAAHDGRRHPARHPADATRRCPPLDRRPPHPRAGQPGAAPGRRRGGDEHGRARPPAERGAPGAARRRHPELLVEAEVDGAPLTDQQVIGFCLLLIAGGHETTSKLIANGVRLFASHPESARRGPRATRRR